MGQALLARALTLTLLLAPLLAPLAVAQDSFQPYVEPATEQARDIKEIFNLTFVIAMVIFVGVEALLFFVLWKFRRNTKAPKEEGHRGHTTAEVVWTVIPAGILLFLGVVSAGTLFELDTVPDDTDYTVKVTASQWAWRFEYPDGNFSSYSWDGAGRTAAASAAREYNESRGRPVSVGAFTVEEGQRVRLDITSIDVIHAVWIPEFGLKIDAVPGQTNVRWFEAPAFDESGDNTYFLQCAEFCGRGHHAMHAEVKVVRAGTFGELGYPTPQVAAAAPEADAT